MRPYFYNLEKKNVFDIKRIHKYDLILFNTIQVFLWGWYRQNL